MTSAPYQSLVAHYTQCFAQHGATPKGVDWPKEEDMPTRHRIMAEVVRESGPCTLLDLGCGYGAMYDWLQAENPGHIRYCGIDLSAPLLDAGRQRHPQISFELRDILTNPLPEQSFDYVVMNGVLTERRQLSMAEMESFATALIAAAFAAARIGIAYNVMSAQVDYERGDLFHWPFDRAAAFLRANVSRHYTFRADYGLYEYTTYVYRNPA